MKNKFLFGLLGFMLMIAMSLPSNASAGSSVEAIELSHGPIYVNFYGKPVVNNTFYTGFPNKLEVKITTEVLDENGIPKDVDYDRAFEITINEGTLNKISEKKAGGLYEITFLKPGEVTITVKIDGKVIESKQFKVVRIEDVPNATAYLEFKNGLTTAPDGWVSQEVLKDAVCVKAFAKDDIDVEVVEFTISCMRMGFEYYYTSHSSAITQEQMDLLQDPKISKSIIIEKIKAKYPDGSIRELSPIGLKNNKFRRE